MLKTEDDFIFAKIPVDGAQRSGTERNNRIRTIQVPNQRHSLSRSGPPETNVADIDIDIDTSTPITNIQNRTLNRHGTRLDVPVTGIAHLNIAPGGGAATSICQDKPGSDERPRD